jgi:hypothetical protein
MKVDISKNGLFLKTSTSSQHRKREVAIPLPIYSVFCFYQEWILPLQTAEMSSMYSWSVDLSGMTQCSNNILIKGCTIQRTTARNILISSTVTVDPSSLLNKLLSFDVIVLTFFDDFKRWLN